MFERRLLSREKQLTMDPSPPSQPLPHLEILTFFGGVGG